MNSDKITLAHFPHLERQLGASDRIVNTANGHKCVLGEFSPKLQGFWVMDLDERKKAVVGVADLAKHFVSERARPLAFMPERRTA